MAPLSASAVQGILRPSESHDPVNLGNLWKLGNDTEREGRNYDYGPPKFHLCIPDSVWMTGFGLV